MKLVALPALWLFSASRNLALPFNYHDWSVKVSEQTNGEATMGHTIAAVAGGLTLLLCIGCLLHYRKQKSKKRHHPPPRQEGVIYPKTTRPKDNEPEITSIQKDMMLFVEIRELLKNKEVLAYPHLDRSYIADLLNTNHTYISRAIKAGSGVNVSSYINKVRINYACELLKQEGASVGKVRVQCGFKTRSYFHQTFKDLMKMSPSEFQKEAEQ